MLKKTHAIFSASISSLITNRFDFILLASVFGVISDLDYVIGLKHRGFTHSLIFATLASIFLIRIDLNLALIAFLAILTHLFLDMMTKGGVPLLYPRKKRYRIANFRYDSAFNSFLIFISILIFATRINLRWLI